MNYKKILSCILFILSSIVSVATIADQLAFTIKFKPTQQTALTNPSNLLSQKSLEKLQDVAPIIKIKKENDHYLVVFNDHEQTDNQQKRLFKDQHNNYNQFHQAMELTRKILKNKNIQYALYRNVKIKALSYGTPKPLQSHAGNLDNNLWKFQWDMHGLYSIYADQAWNDLSSSTLSPVTVAVVDTGIALHPPQDIRNRIIPGLHFTQLNPESEVYVNQNPYQLEGEYHGTHVSGTIVASGPNLYGVTAPYDQIKVLAVKVLSDEGSGYNAAIIAGVEWALGGKPGYDEIPLNTPINRKPAQVVNLSLGIARPKEASKWDWELYKSQYCQAWNNIVQLAAQKNATLVIANGNEPTDVSNSLPAGCENGNAVIVTATGPKGKIAFYSTTAKNPETFGNNTPISAPGGNDPTGLNLKKQILSTVNDGYEYMQGTSMATPHVSGITALLYAINNKTSSQRVKQILKYSNIDNIINAQLAVENINNVKH